MRKAERGLGAGRVVVASLIGSLAIALAGCGGDDGMDAAGTAASNTSTSSTTATTVADTAPANTTGTAGTNGSSTSTVGGTAAVTPPVTSTPVAQSKSQSITFSWEPPTQNSDGSPISNLAGYKIHYGTSSSDYTQTVAVDNAGLTRFVVDNLPSGTYYFAITAYNAQGLESPLSGEITAKL